MPIVSDITVDTGMEKSQYIIAGRSSGRGATKKATSLDPSWTKYFQNVPETAKLQ